MRDLQAGYSLPVPQGWRVGGAVVATEFAAGASCRSVRIVDREGPQGSGPGSQVLASSVQVCARRVTGDASLDDFMRRTYGAQLGRLFARTTLGGVPAYRSGGVARATIFLQTAAHRLQVSTAVEAEGAKRALRVTQVRAVLDGFSLTAAARRVSS